MVAREEHRRIFFIEKKFQTGFILKFCALIIIGSLLTGIIVYVLSQRSTTVVFEHSRAVVKSTSDFLLPLLIQTIVVVSIIVSVSTIILTLFISHRIAGPIYRLKKELGAIGVGDLSGDFSLRKDDQLQDIASSMSAMIKGLRDKIAELKGDWRNFKDGWRGLVSQCAEFTPSLKHDIEGLNDIIAQIDKNFDYFKIQK